MEGLIFRGAYLQREIDWANLIVGSEFTVFALFYFVFEGNFPSTSPRGAYIWRGYLTEGLGGLYLEGLVTWRGLFSEFYGMSLHCVGVRSHLRVKKCLNHAPIGLLQCCPHGLVAFQYHSSSRAAILESEKTQLGMRLGLLWSMVSFRGKKSLRHAWIALH